MLYFRVALYALLFPGTAAGLVPWLLAYLPIGHVEIGVWRFAGLAVCVPGICILLWCIVEFARRGRGTLAPMDPPKRVIREGLYRFMRNPMYVGVVSTILGEAMLYESWLVLCWAVFCAVGFHLQVVLYEEPKLRSVFGEDYVAYCAQVPRWLPRISGPKSVR